MQFNLSRSQLFIAAAAIMASVLYSLGIWQPGAEALAFGLLGTTGDVADKIKAELSRISDQIKTQAEAAEKEIKANAKLSEETRASVDKLLTTQGELQARLQAAEQLVVKLEQGGGGSNAPRSMGEQITASEEYAAFAANPRGSFRMGVKAAITEGAASAGDLIVPQRVPGIITPGQRRLTIRDLINWGRTTSNSIEFARELVYTNSANVVSENPNSNKPESNITFEADTAPVATIAHWIPASRQVLADVPQLQSYIDGRLRYGLKLKEEAQLLKGSGVGLNIDGIYTQATAYLNPGVSVQAETRIDRLRLALLQVELSEYYADAIVLSPIDWASIELLKTTDNAYLFANPSMAGMPSLWGRNIVPTQSMDSGDFLVGAFGGGQAVQGWDREDVSVAISYEDRDNFVKNMVTILCEERVGLTVYRPSAFVKGDFDDIIVAS
ncbi:phage major capsid protein [Azonexus caeni]|uniref:phage major capsid protein n=1 Tax=Azonexus caeni TaxID=266126 RepID=UPI003A86C920